ncbi:unnamed protein product [Callosobruchus maculatus]|uniref:Uncharacterized protein n=1 Tax=Callosobruchus maculatus TaxID=64391 RepID=A0A653BUP2_CALMS|nr:unnamed protein product [Callosobruchus maculatus]
MRICYHMSVQIFDENSFKNALRTLVDFAANRCYKIRVCFYYVIHSSTEENDAYVRRKTTLMVKSGFQG